jgi:hypothetical protein
VQRVQFSTGTLRANQQPVISGTDNVQTQGGSGAKTHAAISSPWGLSFDATDDASSVQEDAVLQVFLDGTEVDTDIMAGMSPTDVDQAVTQALDQAGVDAVFSSITNTINFTSLNGVAISTVQVAYASAPSGDNPVNWLATDITIAS